MESENGNNKESKADLPSIDQLRFNKLSQLGQIDNAALQQKKNADSILQLPIVVEIEALREDNQPNRQENADERSNPAIRNVQQPPPRPKRWCSKDCLTVFFICITIALIAYSAVQFSQSFTKIGKAFNSTSSILTILNQENRLLTANQTAIITIQINEIKKAADDIASLASYIASGLTQIAEIIKTILLLILFKKIHPPHQVIPIPQANPNPAPNPDPNSASNSNRESVQNSGVL